MPDSLQLHGTVPLQTSLSVTISQSLFKYMSFELMMKSNHLILCHSFLLLPSIFPSIRVFFTDLALNVRWPKYWSFSFSISPYNKYSGLISFRIDGLTSLLSNGLSRVFSSTTFESISSSVLSLFYSPTLTSIHDYWKNYSFEYIDLCWLGDVSAF